MSNQKLCPFFKKCGGCLYQDLPDEVYHNKKKNFIIRSFADYGIQVKIDDFIDIPLGSRRRATFAFQGGLVGYNALKSHKIIGITECCLLTPNIESFLPTLKKWVTQIKGGGNISILDTDLGLDIHIKTKANEEPTLQKWELLAELAADNQVVRLTYNHTPILEKSKLSMMPDAFLQPSVLGEKTLTDIVLKNTGSAKKAIDLFCGQGTFTRPLIEKGLLVRGYDSATESVLLLGKHGISRDLFRNPLLPEEMQDIDLIVLDPPRSGAKSQVEQLSKTTIPKIIMISCNPQTAARDIKILINGGWILNNITAVDQFTWSNHIEIVCVLTQSEK